MKMVILGATKGMGRSLARAAAARGDEVFLLGRDLRRSAADLEARANTKNVGAAFCDLLDRDSFAPGLAAAVKHLGRIDAFVITAGLFATQEALEQDLEHTARVLDANYTGTVLLCEHVRKHLLQHGGGTLCVFSSVAGDRGRKPVVLYGSSKAGLSHYLEGLDHKFRAQGLVTINVKPGFIKTSMTEGLKPPPFAGEPDQVARDVLRAIDRGTPCLYTPGMWRWVMFVIKRLPRFVMRKIGF